MQEQEPLLSIDICSLSQVRRIVAMLDLSPEQFHVGEILPRGWHFFLLGGKTRRGELRNDGFPGFGVPMPELGLPRLLLGSRTVYYNSDIVIGNELEQTTFIKSISEKNGSTGRMAIVTIQHELRQTSEEKAAIVETQTYILLEEKKAQNQNSSIKLDLKIPINGKCIIPDETLLFQYSALGFNSHKIHLDRDYTRNVEGLPDLVVNGGLATLLMTEYVRNDLGINLSEIRVKHIAPLFCNRPLYIVPDNEVLNIYNENNEIAITMEYK